MLAGSVPVGGLLCFCYGDEENVVVSLAMNDSGDASFSRENMFIVGRLKTPRAVKIRSIFVREHASGSIEA